MTQPTANELATALAAGQPEGFAALYDRLGRSLLRVARAMLHDSTEAEDALQDVFVQLARHRGRLAQVRDLDAHVFAILRHMVGQRVKHQRRERHHLRRLGPVEDVRAAPVESDDLQEALESLPLEQREVIALKLDGGLTFAQVAEVLQISPNTAASRYRYALDKLRRALE